ncbi:putative transcriptional regulatory protein [Fusarium oxysporum II5]|nr:putative transcriptional regulatory protein [Fusarium oxysporum II5]
MSEAHDEHRPSKRSRISESCKLCRSKKTRCDGQRPTCSPCLQKNAACEYNERDVPISSDILAKIAHLEARIRILESQSIIGNLQATSGPAPCVPEPEDERALSYADNPTTCFISSVTQTSPDQDTYSSTQSHNVIDNDRATHPEVSLPSRAVADNLIDCYEQLLYPMFPVLHMPSFRKRYAQFWEPGPGPKSRDQTFEATVNIVIALGCVNSSSVNPCLGIQTARSFYERARDIMSLDTLGSPSLEVVQYLLLTGNYLSFTKHSHRYCNTLAVAIQIAQTLGLHQTHNNYTTNQLQREMGRRVWHLCLTMQRLTSSLFGWNSVIMYENACPLPQMIDDEYLLEEGEGIQPMNKPSLLDALTVSIKVFNIIAEAREVNVTSFARELQMPELIRILQLNEKLHKIEAELPDHLKYETNRKKDTTRERVLMLQAEVVNIRILYVRLLLFRANLLATARQQLMHQNLTPLQSQIEAALRNEIAFVCVQSALSALNILHTNLQSPSKIISANALFVTLSAATVLIAASVVPAISCNLDDPLSAHAVGIVQAFGILDSHEPLVEGAAETKDKLQQFLQTAKNARHQQRGTPQNHSEPQGSAQLLVPGDESFFTDIDLSGDLWTPNLDWMFSF